MSSIAPNLGTPGATVPVTITGAGFLAVAELAKPGGESHRA